MLCIKCAHCCYWFNNAIVKPQYIDIIQTEADITEEKITIKYEKTFCPYLIKEKGQFSCTVHNYPWFKFTPCFKFIQIEEDDQTNCRIGDWYFNDPQGKEYYKSHILNLWEKHIKGE